MPKRRVRADGIRCDWMPEDIEEYSGVTALGEPRPLHTLLVAWHKDNDERIAIANLGKVQEVKVLTEPHPVDRTPYPTGEFLVNTHTMPPGTFLRVVLESNLRSEILHE